MSTNYSASPATSPPLRISAGTAIKIGFFGALGATLFSLIVSVIIGIVAAILVLLGVVTTNLFTLPR